MAQSVVTLDDTNSSGTERNGEFGHLYKTCADWLSPATSYQSLMFGASDLAQGFHIIVVQPSGGDTIDLGFVRLVLDHYILFGGSECCCHRYTQIRWETSTGMIRIPSPNNPSWHHSELQG